MNRPTSLFASALLAVSFFAALSVVGCASADGGSSAGGSCTTATQCWTITSPANADVRTPCGFVRGTYSTSACPTTGYARRCTQVNRTTSGGQTTEETWVYSFKAGDTTTCLGTEERLTSN